MYAAARRTSTVSYLCTHTLACSLLCSQHVAQTFHCLLGLRQRSVGTHALYNKRLPHSAQRLEYNLMHWCQTVKKNSAKCRTCMSPSTYALTCSHSVKENKLTMQTLKDKPQQKHRCFAAEDAGAGTWCKREGRRATHRP